MIFIGIDPGASGGLAAIRKDGSVVATPMPETETDIWLWISAYGLGESRVGDTVFAWIEKVGGYVPGSGGNIGSAMFTFGRSYGGLRMACVAGGVPFDDMAPAKWQKLVGLHREKGEEKHEWKTALKARAQSLFPSLTVTLKTADAILIAEAGRRLRL